MSERINRWLRHNVPSLPAPPANFESKMKCAEDGCWHKISYRNGKLSIEKCEYGYCQERHETIFAFLSGKNHPTNWQRGNTSWDCYSLSEIPVRLRPIIKFAREKRKGRGGFRWEQERMKAQEAWRLEHGFSREEAIRQIRKTAFLRYQEENRRRARLFIRDLRYHQGQQASRFWYIGPRPKY